MNTKLLIDNIVRQTTVLIAQLSTAAGVRAPLAHVADQMFLSLAREIEAQGVGRKVAADMFGMALRGYQKKTQRLTESQSRQGTTLFEAVLQYIEEKGSVSRSAVLHRFRHDGERETIGVLTDLVSSGLAYSTGRGASSLYGVTSDAERQRLTRASDAEVLADMIWAAVYRAGGMSRAELEAEFGVSGPELDAALSQLEKNGRVGTRDGQYVASIGFRVPVGAERGWESAVFDHFQAVAAAIANKVRWLSRPGAPQAWVGGTTLRFELSNAHPHKQEVLALLEQTRKRLNRIWNRVSLYNDEHPLEEDERFDVVFYFGQNVDRLDDEASLPGVDE